ncbi:hypothetical protein INR49_030865 [Caranx melampygus]|nr:hypothetical protein INR49_030865 [Caranx melampygus]
MSSRKCKKTRRRRRKNRSSNRKTILRKNRPEHSAEPPALEKEKPSQENLLKSEQKNWTNAALSGSKDKNTDVAAWKDRFVPSPVLTALSSLGFGSPTPIQALAYLQPSETYGLREQLRLAGQEEDRRLREKRRKVWEMKTKMTCMKTAVRMMSVMEKRKMGERLGCVQVIENAEFDLRPQPKNSCWSESASARPDPHSHQELAVQVKHHIDAVAKFTDIKTAVVVGGMAQQKQRRMLKRRPEIIIATPGRLWELIKERNPHLLNLRQLRCLVIDEADRMVERGHFAELESLLEMLNTVHFNPMRQTFVFSATLTMAHSLPTASCRRRRRIWTRGASWRFSWRKGDQIQTQSHRPHQEGGNIPWAHHGVCQQHSLYQETLLLLVILDCTPLPCTPTCTRNNASKTWRGLLRETAARGLDIPNVQHVIHYQVPRTSETYVHRSGRTARATKQGLSLLLIGPDDMMNFRKIYKTLGKDEDLPMFPIETRCMEAIQERVNLALKIEKAEFHNSREKQHNSWFRQAAEALEVDLDDDLLIGRTRDEDDDREQQKMLKAMKKHLKHLMSQPVFKNAIKTKYPTQMGKLSLPHMPRSSMESALTRVSTQEKKQKLQTGDPSKKKKRRQRKEKQHQ